MYTPVEKLLAISSSLQSINSNTWYKIMPVCLHPVIGN